MCLSNEAAAIKLAERDNLVGELADSLEQCLEDSEQAITDHILKFGENYKPKRLDAMREKVKKARAALAKADEGAQS